MNRSTLVEATTRAEIAFKDNMMKLKDQFTYSMILDYETTASNAKEVVFYGNSGRLRAYVDERQGTAFNEYKMIMGLDKWEKTITFDVDTLQDDLTGGKIESSVSRMVRGIEQDKEEMAWTYLRNGVSLNGFDREPLFSFTHKYFTTSGATVLGNSAMSNMNLAGLPISSDLIQTLQRHFNNVLADNGQKMGLRLSHIVVPYGSTNARLAKEIANSQYTVETSTNKGQMTSNVFRGSFEIVEIDYGLGENEFYAMDLRNPDMKPLVILEKTENGFRNPVFNSVTDPNSEYGFFKDKVAFGVKARFGFNIGDWRGIYLVGSSATTLPSYGDIVTRNQLVKSRM